MRLAVFAAALAVTVAVPFTAIAAQRTDAGEPDVLLKPTDHPRLPSDAAKLWLVPPKSNGARPAGLADFASAVKLEVDGDFSRALPILSKPGVQHGALGHYAEYYKGLAELRLGRATDARHTFETLASHEPVGYLAEAAALRQAESDEGRPSGVGR